MRKKATTVFLLAVLTAFSLMLVSACSKGGESTVDSGNSEKTDNPPIIVSAPLDKTVETGFYYDLRKDISTAVVYDDESESVELYPESLTHGQTTIDLDREAESVFLGETGEYTVAFAAEDFFGHSTKGSYKLVAVDTTPCVIDAPCVASAWIENGRVKLPSPNVIEVGTYTMTATAKDSVGTAVEVRDGFLITDRTGVYKLCYDAVDGAGNESASESKLIVNERGIINSFDDNGEAVLWGVNTRVLDGTLKFQSSDDEAFIRSDDYFAFNDWSEFSGFSAEISNERGVDLYVTVSVLTEGIWKSTATTAVAPATLDESDYVGIIPSISTVQFNLGDYGFSSAEGIMFEFFQKGGIKVGIKRITLDTTTTSIDVPEENELNGIGNGEYLLSAGEIVSVNLTQTVELQSGANVFGCRVWSNVAVSVQLGFTLDGKTENVVRRLVPGWNILTLKVGSLGSARLSDFYLINKEKYTVKLFVSDVGAKNVASFLKEDYARTDAIFAITYGETFDIPNPFQNCFDMVSDVEVGVSGVELSERLLIGDELIREGNRLEYGSYTITYSYLDALGNSQIIQYGLNVEKKVLVAVAEVPTLFLDGESELPNPILYSEVYTEEELAQATVEKSFREKGKTTWTDANGGFKPTKIKSYEIRYVITLGDRRIELDTERFVHKNKYTIDFEPEETAGTNSLRVVYSTGEDLGTKQSEFLYDGGPGGWDGNENNKFFNISTEWSKSGKTSFKSLINGNGSIGFNIRPLMVTDKDERVNCMSFWLKSDSAMPNALAQIGTFEAYETSVSRMENALKYPWAIWQKAPRFDVLSGEHYYTLFFEEPISVRSISAFYITTVNRNALFIDDIEFSNVNRLSMTESVYADAFDATKAYELARPELISELFTETELQKAAWTAYYSVGGGEYDEVKPSGDGKYYIKNETANFGVITVKWEAVLNGIALSQTVDFNYCFVPLITDAPRVVSFGETVKIPEPISHLSLDEIKVDYRHESATEWTELNLNGENYCFEALLSGSYFIRYKVASSLTTGKIFGESVEKVYVPILGTVFSAEDEDALKGGVNYTSQNYAAGMSVKQKKDGTHWFEFAPIVDGWDGISFNYGEATGLTFDLGADTTKLSFDTYSEREFKGAIVDVLTEESDKWYMVRFTIPAGNATHVIDFADDGATNIRRVRSLAFRLAYDEQITFYVDDIRIVNDFQVNANVSGEPTDNVLRFIPTVGFTLETPADVSSTVFSAVYREKGSEEWLTANKLQSEYSFPVAVGKVYEIKVVAEYNGETAETTETVCVSASADSVALDFESEWTDTDWGKSYNGAETEHTSVMRYQGNAVSGEWSLLINTTGEGRTWTKDSVGFDLSQYNSIGFWITCSTSGTLRVWFNGGYAETSAGISIKPGTHYYVMDVSSISGNTNKIWFGNNNIEMYMDDLAFFS